MTSLITAETMLAEIRKLAKTAALKADDLDGAFLKRADPRAIQGGAICEEADEWRRLASHLLASPRIDF